MVQIKWLPEAKIDLKEIHDYIALDSKKFTEIQIRKIKQRTEILKLQPEIGKLVEEVNHPKIREIIIGNYRIIYRNVSSKVIDILMIHHAARDMYRRIKN
jgi:addiction module RelE/StbE family toxin